MSNQIQSPAAEEEIVVSSDYFSQIPLWSPDGQTKRFEVMADELSGRIPVTRLESWRDFTQLLESNFFNRHGVQLVFRGHRRHDWGLMPTLGRVTTNGIITEVLADDQLDRFRRAVRGRLSDTALVDEPDELWSVGQHHGLMTPLLDWTYSPYVALFFAFHKEDGQDEKDNPYRAVYVLNKSFLVDNETETGIRVFEPRKDHHGRLVNQAGLFTYSPYDATLENKLTDVLTDEDGFTDEELRAASEDEQPQILARYICKIYIKNEGRDACVRHLRRMNVHHASLFPDLIGASDYCNILTAEAEQAAEIARQAAKAAAGASQPTVEPLEPAVEAPAAATGSMRSIEDVLRAPAEAQQVEPGRIPLIAQELAKVIASNKVVDWDKREAVQARLRNGVRVVLRKYAYPSVLRDRVTEQVLELAKITLVIDGGTY
ncbi:FRG domain-containing protein [Limnohabitans sp.]|uniref:FRG domain-containing protein n=1 Tax=Limnohabitans sp. TaxID=1907725 RepID=UPI0037BE9E67